ncbi:hypothetical protein GCM10007884_12230 [Methylobacterium brachythecii]|uniref:Uncharacterized protein n=1 Tax=Methylobacterium brachythecii TaxID=1176177 RepID=A0ABQ6D4L4_9HYPH|nr:hypothetical protein GCM10007884_12230 [Methylobacterium brachythecii]
MEYILPTVDIAEPRDARVTRGAARLQSEIASGLLPGGNNQTEGRRVVSGGRKGRRRIST